MSFEGYITYYCFNGHRGRTCDVNDDPETIEKCQVCGDNLDMFEIVDQTNGYNKPKINKIICYDPIDCPDCCNGMILTNRLFRTKQCSCVAGKPLKDVDKTCLKCFGRGIIGIPDEASNIQFHCRKCSGSGRLWVASYDVMPLKKKFKKLKFSD